MADSSDEDLEAIAWPGFVDILSSVIIMFVFFMLVIASVLYFHMVIFVSKVRSEEALESTITDFELLMKQEQSEFAESKSQETEVNEASDEMIIFFGKDAISVTMETAEKIAAFLANYSPDEYIVHITSPKPEKAKNIIEKKVAIARMFNVRNAILDAEFPKEQALPRLIKYEEINDQDTWTRIKLIRKEDAE